MNGSSGAWVETFLEMMAAERGKAFDPDIVDCFMRHSDALWALRERVAQKRLTFADLTTSQP